MKNDIFSGVATELKIDYKLFVLWNVSRPDYWMTMSLCQAMCMVFYGEPQHFLWRHCWQHKMDVNFIEKKNNWSIIIQGCTLKLVMLCQIKFGLLFKISNYHYCVFISCHCTLAERTIRCSRNNLSVLRNKIWATSWQNQQSECAPSLDSDQPGHPPSLIRVFAVRSVGSLGSKLFSCGQRRLWSDWADAQADLSLRWAHNHIVGFVMRQLIYLLRLVS